MYRRGILIWIVTVGLVTLAAVPISYGQDVAIPPLLKDLGISSYTTSNDSGRVGSLSLSAVLARVLSSNPAMRAARYQIERASGRLVQAGVYANPEIGINVEDFGRASRGGPSQTTIGITQPLILWGKRGARREAARAEVSAASVEINAVALELYRQTAEAFVGILGAQQNLSNAEERLRLAKEIEAVVQMKLLEGAVPKSELLRAQASASLAAIEVDRARSDIERQKYNLSSLWGGDGDVEIVGDLRWVETVPTSDALEVLLDDHPILAGLRFRRNALEAELSLAKALVRPDVNLSAGYRRLHDSGDNAVLFGAAVPIPLFDRNRGGVAEASSRVKVAEAELVSLRQSLRRDLHYLWATLGSQTQEMTSLTEGVLPAMEQAFREIDESYRLGRQPYINVLDAQRTLADTQSRLVEVTVSRARMATAIESLIGHKLDNLRRQ